MKPWILPLMVFAVLLTALLIAGVQIVSSAPVPNEIWGIILSSFGFLTGAGATAKQAG